MQTQGHHQGSAPAVPLQLQSASPTHPTGAQPSMPSAIVCMADAPNPFRALVSAEAPLSAKPMFAGLNAVVNPFRSPPSSPPHPQSHAATAGAAAAASDALNPASAPAVVGTGRFTAAVINPSPQVSASAAIGSDIAPSITALPNPFAKLATPALVGAGHSSATLISPSQQVSTSAAAAAAGSDTSAPATALPNPSAKLAVPALFAAERSTAAPINPSPQVSASAAVASDMSPPATASPNPFAKLAAPALVGAGLSSAAPVSHSQQASAAVGSSLPGSPTPAATTVRAAAASPAGQDDRTASTAVPAPAHNTDSIPFSMTPAASAAPAIVAAAQAAPQIRNPVQAEAATASASALPSTAVPSAAEASLQVGPSLAPAPGLPSFKPTAASAPPIPAAISLQLAAVAASVAAAVTAAAANRPLASVAAAVPLAAAAVPTAAANLPLASVSAAVPATAATLPPASVPAAVPAAAAGNRPASKRKWDVMAQPQPDAATATAAAAAPHAVTSGIAAASHPPPLVALFPKEPTAQARHKPLESGAEPLASSGATGPVQLPIPGPPQASQAAMGVSLTSLVSAAALPVSQPPNATEAARAAASKALAGKDLAAKLAADFAEQHRSKQSVVASPAGPSGMQAAPVDVSLAFKVAAAAAAEKVLQERAVRAKAAAEKHIHEQAMRAKQSVLSSGDVHAARMEALRLRNAARHDSPQPPAVLPAAADLATAVAPEPQLAVQAAAHQHPGKSQHPEAMLGDSRSKKKRGRDEDHIPSVQHETAVDLPGPPADLGANLSNREKQRTDSPVSAGSRDSLKRQAHSSDSRQAMVTTSSTAQTLQCYLFPT